MFATATLSSEESVRLMSWTEYAADGMAAMLLDQVQRPADSFDQLERIGAWEKIVAWAQARQCVEIVGFVADATAAPSHGMSADQAAESARAEVGLVLSLAPGSTAWRVADAQRLVEDFPATFAALQAGEITLVKARIIADGCADLGPDAAAAVERRVLPRAPRQTNGQLRAAVARAVKREDTDAAERRRQRKQRERGVVLYPERDGMATLSATLPAAEAVGVFAVLDQHARGCGSADGRAMDARRADALVDLVLRETGFSSAGAAPAGPATSAPAPAPAPTSAPAAGSATATPDCGTDPGCGTGMAAAETTSAAPVAALSTGTTAPAGTAASAGAAAAAAGNTGGGDQAAGGQRDSAGLPVAPAPSRLPAIAPDGGVRAVTNSVSVQIRVIVSLDTLRGANDDPAELAGYGPITAAQARELAADPDSVWRRLVTDPLSGAIVDFGTTRYRPPPDMAERVVCRHQCCQYPGCRVPAHLCDLDHNEPFDPTNDTGPTSDANLGPKCRPHHRLKGMRGWNVTQYQDGTIRWITPSGHSYLVEPPPLTEPRVLTADDGPPPF